MLRFIANVGAKALSSVCQSTNQISRPPLVRLLPSIKLLTPPPPLVTDQVRSVIKFSMRSGARKSVRAVLKRFYRLNWGIWIRTKAGRYRKQWARTPTNRRQLREHVFCNATQSKLLDRMVCEYWRKPKYYIEDPYTPYHTREEFPITRKKPWRPEGWE